MDFGDDIIIINGQDKTDSIESITVAGTECMVKFLGGSKVYPYSAHKVKRLSLQHVIDHTECAIREKGRPLTGIIKAMHYGEYVKVWLGDKKCKLHLASDIEIVRNCLADEAALVLKDYFADLAATISLKTEDGIAILARQYENLSFVGEDSMLGQYLLPPELIKSAPAPDVFIYPFGINPSQKEAAVKAMTTQISIIQGPPGTGKTQTILNIIANIVHQGKTVAVVSGNNSATANVLEKLKKYGLDSLCAPLGSNDNKAKFIDNQTGAYPDIARWKASKEGVAALERKITLLATELDAMLLVKNRTAELKQKISALIQEEKYFDVYHIEAYHEVKTQRALSRLSAGKILQLWLEFEHITESNRSVSLWLRLKARFIYGIRDASFYSQRPERIIPLLQSLYYLALKSELGNELNELEYRLSDYHFNDRMRELSEKSMILFRAKLAERYGKTAERQRFDKNDLWKKPDAFVHEYPVVLSTTYSAKTSLSKNFQFDYIIVDEASQVDLATGVLALSCAKNAVIVGDTKQLPNVITPENKQKAAEIAGRYNPRPCYSYNDHSLLSSAVAVWPTAPRTLLREHYRCHPKIIGFCNQKFYNNQLIVMTEDKGEPDVIAAYYTRPGNHARQRVNQRQLDIITEEILPELNAPIDSVGIVAPYRAQANEASKQSSGEIEADTVHKYQGREKDNIIITTVDNQIGEFADNPNMLNVAVSRAAKRLRVVISPDEWNENTNTGDLVRYIKYHNFEVVYSKVYSVFDLLYEQYTRQRLEFLAQNRQVSEYASENIMYAVIQSVLAQEAFAKLGVIVHQPLRIIVRDMAALDADEQKYAMNYATHVDFVFYNRLDKMPIMAVEVDGAAYHTGQGEQARRDSLKNSIFEKLRIPLLRLRTDGSGEERRLQEALRCAMEPRGAG